MSARILFACAAFCLLDAFGGTSAFSAGAYCRDAAFVSQVPRVMAWPCTRIEKFAKLQRKTGSQIRVAPTLVRSLKLLSQPGGSDQCQTIVDDRIIGDLDNIAGLNNKEIEKLLSNNPRDTINRNRVVTYSRKVFIPLTRLCRDKCHYCT